MKTNFQPLVQPLGKSGSRTFPWLASLTATLIAGCGYDNLNQFAEDPKDHFEQRFYVGAGVLGSRLDPDTTDDSAFSVAERGSAGGSITAGMDITPSLSVEAHVADLGAVEMRPQGDLEYAVGGVSLIGYGLGDAVERAERRGLSAYGRVGVGGMDNSSNDVPFERINDYHVVLGAGVEYGFDNGLGLRGEIVAHDTDASYAQLGLVYRIGDGAVTAAPQGKTAEVVTPATGVTAERTAEVLANPAGDADADGVSNENDACIGTLANTPVDSTGCQLFNGVIEGVEFSSASANLTAAAIPVLEDVAAALLRYPELRINVEAHTDAMGDARANMDLSKQRAIAVARYLVSRGVASDRLRLLAFGEGAPRATNDTPEGRSMNRRIELIVQ